MTISTSTCLEEGPQGFFISEDNTVRITHLNIEDEGWEQFLFLFFYPFISVSCFCCLLQTRFKLGCFVSSEQNDKNVLLVILKKMLCFSPFFLKIKQNAKSSSDDWKQMFNVKVKKSGCTFSNFCAVSFYRLDLVKARQWVSFWASWNLFWVLLNALSVLMFAILGHLFFSLDSQFPLLCFSFLSDQYSQAISNVFQSLLSSAIIVLNYCLSLFLFSSFFLLNSSFVISFKLKAVVRCKTVSHQKRKKRKRKTVPWLPWVLIYRK